MQTPETLSKSNQINRPPLVLIGASVRAAAQSARRGGYRVIGIDLFGDTDTRELCDEFYLLSPGIQQMPRPELGDRVLAAIRGLPILPVGGLRCWPADLPASGLVGGELKENGPTGSRLAGNGPTGSPLAGNRSPGEGRFQPLEALREFDDLQEFADDPIIRFPETTKVMTPPSHGKWLRKRIDSCGGLGIRWAASGGQDHLGDQEDSGDQGSQMRLQRWVRGRPFGATLICDGCQTTLIGVCRAVVNRIGPFPFVHSGSIGPVVLAPRVTDGITRFATRVAQTRRLQGLFNLDFILGEQDRAWILEVNPRWSASMELIENQLRESDPTRSLIAMDLQSRERPLCGAERSSLGGRPRSIYSKRIHFASRPLVFDRKRWAAALRPGVSLHDVPADGQQIGAREPICTEIERLEWSKEES
ncbi:MAG: ATP-grasp domain-containing protein [Rubripirellula sp.]|nr:ATP-grasp domain-containing protein [Rubripirellula sp.]